MRAATVHDGAQRDGSSHVRSGAQEALPERQVRADMETEHRVDTVHRTVLDHPHRPTAVLLVGRFFGRLKEQPHGAGR